MVQALHSCGVPGGIPCGYARCVLQLFHSMGRIFREQSASDAIQTGLHIDRKRHRMLREKRMAWDTRPMTMRKSPSILKDKMGDCH